MNFPYLAEYAEFLVKDRLDDLARLNIAKAKEVNLPLLAAFKDLSKEELFTYSKDRFKEFLTALIEGRGLKDADEGLTNWKYDNMPGIKQNQINAEDIVLTTQTRKYAMVYLLPDYTSEISKYQKTNLELEDLFNYILNSSIKQYAEIQDRILKKEEQFISLVLNNIPDGISSYDKNRRITVWNKSLEARTGLTKEKVLGKDLLTLLPNYQNVFNDELYAKILGGETVKMENMPYSHREGYFNIEMHPLKKDGEIIGGVSISRDITDEKIAQQEIQDKNRHLEILNKQLEKEKGFSRALLKSEVNGIIGLDTNLNYTVWNPVMEKLLGKKASEVIGKNIFEVFPGSENSDSIKAFNAALNGESTILISKKGISRGDFYYDAYVMPLLNDQQKVTGVVSLLIDVSEKKIAEKKLIEREHFLEKITNITPAIIGIYNSQNGKYLYMNKAITSILGYLPEETILGEQNIFETIIHPDDSNRVLMENKKAIDLLNSGLMNEEKYVYLFEYRVKHKNGEWKWLKTFGTVFSRDHNNMVESILNISVDITERKKTEKELLSNNEIINGILKHLPVVATRVDSKGFITESIGAGLDSLSMAQNQSVGKHILDGFPHNTQYSSEILEGKPSNFISIMDHPDGKKYHQNYFFQDNNQEGFIGFSLDITAQKEAEIKLLESQKFIEKIAEIAPFPIAVVDAKMERPIYFNYEALRILGYTDEEIKAKKVVELLQITVHPDDVERLLERNKAIATFTDETISELEYRIKDNKGNWLWLSSKVKVFTRDDSGNVEQYISVASDVTERKRQEMEIAEKNKELEAILEELRNAQEQLRGYNIDLEKKVTERTKELAASEEELKQTLEKSVELNEEILRKNEELTRINNDLDNFIYTASHDLKSPISNMEGLMYSIEKTFKTKLEDRDKKLFEMMGISIDRLKNTITSLTDISKITKNHEELSEAISFKEILDDVKEDLKQSFEDLEYTIEEDILAIDVNFVKPNLRSIVFNLLSNAFKYRSSDRALKIVIKTTLSDNYFNFSIQDNGLGIRPEQKEKLFMLFRRLHKHVEGTGVGLYIVKRMVENAGGKIQVDSLENVGTTFTISIPLKK